MLSSFGVSVSFFMPVSVLEGGRQGNHVARRRAARSQEPPPTGSLRHGRRAVGPDRLPERQPARTSAVRNVQADVAGRARPSDAPVGPSGHRRGCPQIPAGIRSRTGRLPRTGDRHDTGRAAPHRQIHAAGRSSGRFALPHLPDRLPPERTQSPFARRRTYRRSLRRTVHQPPLGLPLCAGAKIIRRFRRKRIVLGVRQMKKFIFLRTKHRKTTKNLIESCTGH